MDCEHGGNVWSVDRQSPERVYDFSANLNPLGPPAGVLDLLREKIGFVGFYPEPRARTLRLALAERLGLAEESVIVGNGASELISLFFLVQRPERVLIPAPTYGDYARAALSAGGEVDNFFFDTADFSCPLEVICEELARRCPDAFVFCNPNNPTGVFWEDVLPLLEVASAVGTSLLLDASFLPFTGVDWLDWPGREEFLPFWRDGALPGRGFPFIVISLTKIFSLPGLRLGFGVGPPPLIEKMEAARDPWSVNSLAQLAGLQCLREGDYLARSLALVGEEREYLYRGLKEQAGLRPFASRANFLLVDCRGTSMKAAEIASALLEKGVMIRDAGNFPGLDEFYLRVAVKKREENALLLKELGQVIGSTRKLED